MDKTDRWMKIGIAVAAWSFGLTQTIQLLLFVFGRIR